jgi:hypothetical protein
MELVVAMILSAGLSTGETTKLIQRLNARVFQLVHMCPGVTKEKHVALCNARFIKSTVVDVSKAKSKNKRSIPKYDNPFFAKLKYTQ